MRKMTEAEAWLILAEEYDAGKTKSKFLCISLSFPASEVYRSDVLAEIPEDLRREMINRIEYALGERSTAYNSFEDDDKQGRVLACLMFAAQAEDGVPYAD